MVCMPPGSAKSTYTSELLPPWWFAQHPHSVVIGASHTMDLAARFSKRVQRQIRDNAALLGYGMRDGSEGVARWETTSGGEYRAAGVGGNVTGSRADLCVIDDPVRSREDAESEVARERNWQWFTADLRTRLKPGARIVLVMTRWHADDLGGRLLETQRALWRVVSLPATAREDDPLGRVPGEMLWSDDPSYPYGAEIAKVRAEYEAAGAMRDWWSLYEQDPRPLDGALFKTGQIATLDAAPAGGKVVRAWDLAATEQVGTRDPDWTAGVKLMRTDEGRFVVLDVVRLRGGPDEIEAAIVNTAAQDGQRVTVGLAQDPGQAGKSQILYLTRKLAGFRVESSPETGAKETRAAPVASQVNVGNVSIVRHPAWNKPFLDELAGFPADAKDDQVDALSRAFSMLIAPPEPARRVNIPFMAR